MCAGILGRILLYQFDSRLGKADTSDSGEDERNHLRRNSRLKRITKHALFDLPLL